MKHLFFPALFLFYLLPLPQPPHVSSPRPQGTAVFFTHPTAYAYPPPVSSPHPSGFFSSVTSVGIGQGGRGTDLASCRIFGVPSLSHCFHPKSRQTNTIAEPSRVHVSGPLSWVKRPQGLCPWLPLPSGPPVWRGPCRLSPANSPCIGRHGSRKDSFSSCFFVRFLLSPSPDPALSPRSLDSCPPVIQHFSSAFPSPYSHLTYIRPLLHDPKPPTTFWFILNPFFGSKIDPLKDGSSLSIPFFGRARENPHPGLPVFFVWGITAVS